MSTLLDRGAAPAKHLAQVPKLVEGRAIQPPYRDWPTAPIIRGNRAPLRERSTPRMPNIARRVGMHRGLRAPVVRRTAQTSSRPASRQVRANQWTQSPAWIASCVQPAIRRKERQPVWATSRLPHGRHPRDNGIVPPPHLEQEIGVSCPGRVGRARTPTTPVSGRGLCRRSTLDRVYLSSCSPGSKFERTRAYGYVGAIGAIRAELMS